MISVIALAHDRDKHLDFTMECWKQQTCKDFELNIFESGNLDSTINILRKYKNDIKINCWRLHTKWVHKTMTLNFLANHCNGDIVCVWDVDIFKSPDYLENCLKNISNENVIVQFARYINTAFTDKIFKERLTFKQIVECDRTCPTCFSHADGPSQLFMYKKDFLAIGGFYEKLFGWGWEDNDFFERIKRYGKKIVSVEPCGYHLEHTIKNNYMHTGLSNKSSNRGIYESNCKENICKVDNSNIKWLDNLWNVYDQPKIIQL